MAGAFDASAEFEEDLLVTADEIQACGMRTLSVLEQVTRSGQPWTVDLKLVKEIHFRWFETTFPLRKLELAAREPGADRRRGSGPLRGRRGERPHRSHLRHSSVHRGNTRVSWHLRNYLLMLDGLPPLDNLIDRDGYTKAWWAATAEEHADLDRAVAIEISAQIEAEGAP